MRIVRNASRLMGHGRRSCPATLRYLPEAWPQVPFVFWKRLSRHLFARRRRCRIRAHRLAGTARRLLFLAQNVDKLRLGVVGRTRSPAVTGLINGGTIGYSVTHFPVSFCVVRRSDRLRLIHADSRLPMTAPSIEAQANPFCDSAAHFFPLSVADSAADLASARTPMPKNAVLRDGTPCNRRSEGAMRLTV